MVLSRPIPTKLHIVAGALQALIALPLLVLVFGLLAGTVPALIEYESFVVQSGSMEPAIHVGDLAVAAPARPDQLGVGDVIVYRTAENPAIIVTHRLVGIEVDEEGRLSFQTKGDANNTVDRVLVSEGAVMGRVVYSIPRLGYLASFAQRAEGKLILIAVPAALLFLDSLISARRRDKRQPKAETLLTRGRTALYVGHADEALLFFDQAIALDPRLDEAWLLKAECLVGELERVVCLRAGLTVNPTSERLREALERLQVTAHAT
ncbi:MAG TPA: signal peptidase I [Ardenticatenaceae bacterium]|nr:signal peptidase I [Ardenticatenaceae bacterium]